MPTITTVALESLLHSKPRKPPPSPNQYHRDNTTHHTNTNISSSNNNNNGSAKATAPSEKPKSQPYYMIISPALYATPEPGPIPESSPVSADSPSPYIVNRKSRRNLRSAAAAATSEATEPESQRKDDETVDEKGQGGEQEEEEEERGLDPEVRCVKDDDDDDFFEPRARGCMSAGSSSSSDAAEERVSLLRRSRFGHCTSLTSQSEYYDAAEDFLSDGSMSNSSPSFSTHIEKDMRTLRLSFSEEVDKRKKAEEDLLQIHMQLRSMARCLSNVGLLCPEIQHSGNIQLEMQRSESMELELDAAALCQQIIVTKLVSEAVERGIARAETEAVAEAIIESKNHEISRLRDRLQYYEAVNREMSQRNQEAVELARQKRSRKKTRRGLIWGCIGLSISIGASLLVYSHFPHFAASSAPTSSPDAPSFSTTDLEATEAC